MHRIADRDFLLRDPASGRAAIERTASYGGSNACQRINGGDPPVRTKGQHRACREQRLGGPGVLRTLRSDSAAGPAGIVDAMIGLHRGDHAQPSEGGDVGSLNMLRMLNAESAITFAVGALDPVEEVENNPIGPVADGMDGQLQTGLVAA